MSASIQTAEHPHPGGLNPVLHDPRRLDPSAGFVLATGIECSAPVVEGGIRRDELRLTGHWERFEEDFDLVADLGITFLRYGIPFHVVAADPDQLDWAWTDRAMAAMHERGIEPIADLLHFGVPDDLIGMSDPRLPGRFAAYVAAFAERYPWVRWYTPVNEPFITAHFSGKSGRWNERGRTDLSFVAALETITRCAVEGMQTIRARRRDAVFLQSDVCESHLPEADDPRAVEPARFLDELRFVTFQLAYGQPPSAEVIAYLRRNGMSDRSIDWFAEHGSSEGCIVGLDYYAGNEHLMGIDGSDTILTERRGLAALAREYHAALGLPLFLAETNHDAEGAPEWLAELWNDALTLREEGIPIRGFCWYSLTDQVDWDTGLVGVNGTVNSFGLVDLDRRLRPVGQVYRDLALAARDGRFDQLAMEDTEAAA